MSRLPPEKSGRENNRFEVRLDRRVTPRSLSRGVRTGRIGGSGSQSFVKQLNRAVAIERAVTGRRKGAPKTGRFNARGRGRKVLAGLSQNTGWQTYMTGGRVSRSIQMRNRRVIVKARVVKLKGSVSKAAYAHLRYLQREGAGLARETTLETPPETMPESERDLASDTVPDLDRDHRGILYDGVSDAADGNAFLKRGADDRHQFRFIVSPEDGAQLGELKPFIRDLVGRMEQDLETRLDWVAVDHFDTSHPHTHLVVRGVTDDGKILNIAGDYIAHGIRARASEQLTLELGQKSQLEVMRELSREVKQDRLTRLDRELVQAATPTPDGNLMDLRPGTALDPNTRHRINRHLLIGRAKHLEAMGLAQKLKPGLWALSPDTEQTLRTMGERGDIIKAMHRAMRAQNIERPISLSGAFTGDAPLTSPIIARVIGKGLGQDELKGDLRLIVDGADGRVRSVEVTSRSEAMTAPLGSVVEIGPPRLKPADRAIIAEVGKQNGIYDPDQHKQSLLATRDYEEATELVTAHVRRLEALRRKNIVTRQTDGSWLIPEDYAGKALALEYQNGRRIAVKLLSDMSLETQITSDGATWLDRTLLKGDAVSHPPTGFGEDVMTALQGRLDHLRGQGLVQTSEGRVTYRQNLLATLTRRELQRIGKSLEASSGKTYRQATSGEKISGVYTKQLQLGSGRYALVARSKEFTLVPWRSVIEPNLGREVSGVMRGMGISWQMGRSRGLGISR